MSDQKSSIIDSHCHIVFSNFDEDREKVAERWRSQGVKALLHACVEPSEIPAIKSLADQFHEMRYSVGVHPLDVHHWRPETLNVLKNAALDDKRVVAIGELGLDLFKAENLSEQLSILMPQLKLAYELNLPVIVHCRDAAKEMQEVFSKLTEENCCPRGVMHCWSGNLREMRDFLDLGFYISFSGNVTFKKAIDIHECAREVPSTRFLVETDSPFLSPVPHRGKRNEPSFVRHVVEKISELKGESFYEIAEKSTQNARKLFGLP
ncbi:TatD family hydrolase [Prochlorococcus marinus]|uniref:D-aminoacyl-tRNA deacylase n=1 Tax=Prochlorococcus marinus XMU1408 TaxID=2213228 RepID=A0A318QXA1_PROMR|nr:TatD family hydrolase [Prochlorococcus marinus]MBW3042661.1 deoxyribonuclease [Prochlorococcus marinus str. XMU1408]PYE01356.1 deoxyribonuclease [Prochlorococcus marinus XMU1408]